MNDTLTNEFILQIFHLCYSNNKIFDLVSDKLQTNWFPEEKQQAFFEELKKLRDKGAKKLMWSVFELEFRKNKEFKDYAKEVEKYNGEYEEKVVLSKLSEFIKVSKFIQLYDEMANLFNKGQRDKAITTLIQKAEDLSNFSLENYTNNSQVFGGFQKFLSQTIKDNSRIDNDKLPFGIDELDRVTHGGASLGELILVMGDAKSGKSFLLNHCGVNAARRGWPVLHYQLEGSMKQAQARYHSNWSGTSFYDIKAGNISDEKIKALNKLKNAVKSDIYIECAEKFGSVNMSQIRKKAIEYKKKYGIKVLVIDYADLCDPDDRTYSANEERFRQQKTIRFMKDLAVELDIIIYTATQTSSVPSELANDPDFVITREYLAEDKGKVRPVDMLFSINRTRDERKEKICRIYMDALREHDSGQVIKIKQNLSNSRFYDRKRTLEWQASDYEDEED